MTKAKVQRVKATVVDPGLEIDGAAHLLSFADANRVGVAMALADWSVEEEIRRLALLARHGATSRVRLVAMTRLRKIATEALYLSGRLQKLTARGTTDSGATLTVEQTRLALSESRPPTLQPISEPQNDRRQIPSNPESSSDSNQGRNIAQENRETETDRQDETINVSRDDDTTCIHKPPVPFNPATDGAEQERNGPAEEVDPVAGLEPANDRAPHRRPTATGTGTDPGNRDGYASVGPPGVVEPTQ